MSDRRLKKDISPLSDISKLNSLNPVFFKYDENSELFNSDKKHKQKRKIPQNLQSGFIAQEVQEVYPHLVNEVDSLGTLGINTTGLIPYLVRAFQVQQATIDKQQLEIDELKKLLNK